MSWPGSPDDTCCIPRSTLTYFQHISYCILGPKVLASSSRDRLIHVYDTEQQYGLLQTLSDHSSSISAVRFTETDGQLKMISCGADKSILFRNLQQVCDSMGYLFKTNRNNTQLNPWKWSLEGVNRSRHTVDLLIGWLGLVIKFVQQSTSTDFDGLQGYMALKISIKYRCSRHFYATHLTVSELCDLAHASVEEICTQLQ